MNASHPTLALRLYLLSAFILVVGSIAALLVFATASPVADPEIVGYRIAGGIAFPVRLGQSPRDVRVLKAEGGRANLDAAELNDWIGSLWHGRRLSYSLATATIVLAGLCAYAAWLSAEGIAERSKMTSI